MVIDFNDAVNRNGFAILHGRLELRRARLYEITAAGRKRLGAEEARWRAVTSAVGHILQRA
jgi:hypothetical protein